MTVDSTTWPALRFSSVQFDLVEPVETARTGGGALISASLGDAYWVMSAELPPGKHGAQSAIEAPLSRLRRPGARIEAYDPSVNGPAADPRGILLGAAAPVIETLESDGVSLTVSGLPAGYLLSAGDWLGIEIDDVPQLYRLVTGAQADATGLTTAFEVEPTLRFDVEADLAVTLVRPVAWFQVTEFRPGVRTVNGTAGATLSAEQVFTE